MNKLNQAKACAVITAEMRKNLPRDTLAKLRDLDIWLRGFEAGNPHAGYVVTDGRERLGFVLRHLQEHGLGTD